MKQLTSYKTTTFADGDFRIDIVEMKSMYEAWLCHKDYGVKDFVFGVKKGKITLDEFLKMVEIELPTNKELYVELHCE